ncbi:alpha/beta hydrolase [Sphingobacterium sp. lm-10]|nr:alpha/beta hydrolase [Sphingobacterium sp. lm-10]
MIKLKGIKRTFSIDPIDYKKLRNEDIHFPKKRYFKRRSYVKTFTVLNTTVTEVLSEKQSNKLLLFIHGGAFVYGPVKHHWDTIEKISRQTGHTIWMCDYPKAPEHKISEISRNIDKVYNSALEKVGSDNILCIGDSVGATLLITLTQRLIQNSRNLPGKLFLISPVIDPSFKNPDIDSIEDKDPILSKRGVVSAKLMCADHQNLSDPLLSPISGSFEKFPETVVFAAENDISYPDQKLFLKELEKERVITKVYIGEGMPHIWPLLPVMREAREALNTIIKLLNEE